MVKKKTVLALGFFDGIHIGHGQLLKMATKRANELCAEPAVLTFDLHPDIFVRCEQVSLINCPHDKVYIIQKYFDIGTVYFLHFNTRTMNMCWSDFLASITEKYNCVHFVAGEDFTFGAGGRGNAENLLQYCRDNGLGCDIIPEVVDGGRAVSSTRIRSLIENGDIAEANRLLGHPHLMTGIVRTGYRLGRTMQAPTVNMEFEEGVIIPKMGVYIAKALFLGQARQAVLNIGTRPTFDGDKITIEAHILDYEGDLYGERICIELYAYIRPEPRFDSTQDLTIQIKKDIQNARAFFVNNK